MKQFLIRIFKFFAIAVIPLVIISAIYLYLDPFKVIRSYNDYSNYPFVNREYISTTVFTKNYQKNNYNSFILGSSRTLAFRASEWKKYLSKDDKPYVFDASAETLTGIYNKIKYLDSLNVKIENALIIICRDNSFDQVNHKGYLYIKHPLTSKGSNLSFHLEFFKAFLNPGFLLNYTTYRISGRYNSPKIRYDTITNQITMVNMEANKHPSKSYLEQFYPRKGERIDSVNRIKEKHIRMFREIAGILKKHHTKYKVVISPLYEQIKFTPTDIGILKNTFGDHIFDFSGNNSFTSSYKNFYEKSHYRPVIGDTILSEIYGKKADLWNLSKR